MAYLASKGIQVAPFKVGPDFIDPGLHKKISNQTSYNLDSWMLPNHYNRNLFADKSQGKDIAIVEGVMGLFDGYDPLSDIGSTAHMAKLLELPVVLVVSAKGKARSAAAVVKGFETFDPDLKLAGVIFAKAGSERHYQYMKQAVEQECITPCLGYMPKNDKIIMPERHLGLVTADEMSIPKETLDLLISMVDTHLDMDGLIKGLSESQSDLILPNKSKTPGPAGNTKENKPVIAVARDKAFCFYYPDNIDMLRSAGAEITFFSPLEDRELPKNIDGLYFGGGYPELNADQLSEKSDLLCEIQTCSLSNMPIYGECGGFMYLCGEVSAMDGNGTRPMCDIFDFSIQMSGRLRSLGYREVTLKSDTLIGKKGDKIRGHEFHYSSIIPGEYKLTGVNNVYQVASRVGQDISLEGYQVRQTLGSYLHVHFGSNPNSAKQFVDSCARFRHARLGIIGKQP